MYTYYREVFNNYYILKLYKPSEFMDAITNVDNISIGIYNTFVLYHILINEYKYKRYLNVYLQTGIKDSVT